VGNRAHLKRQAELREFENVVRDLLAFSTRGPKPVAIRVKVAVIRGGTSGIGARMVEVFVPIAPKL